MPYYASWTRTAASETPRWSVGEAGPLGAGPQATAAWGVAEAAGRSPWAANSPWPWPCSGPCCAARRAAIARRPVARTDRRAPSRLREPRPADSQARLTPCAPSPPSTRPPGPPGRPPPHPPPPPAPTSTATPRHAPTSAAPPRPPTGWGDGILSSWAVHGAPCVGHARPVRAPSLPYVDDEHSPPWATSMSDNDDCAKIQVLTVKTGPRPSTWPPRSPS